MTQAERADHRRRGRRPRRGAQGGDAQRRARRHLHRVADAVEVRGHRRQRRRQGPPPRPVAVALHARQLDALDVGATVAAIKETGSQIVVNLGTAFVNMAVLEACLETGAAYLDTAIHEDPDVVCEDPPWYANHEWKRAERCADAGCHGHPRRRLRPRRRQRLLPRSPPTSTSTRSTRSTSSTSTPAATAGTSPRTSTRRSTSASSSRCGRGSIASGSSTRPTPCGASTTSRSSARSRCTSPVTTSCTRCPSTSTPTASGSGWASATTTSTSSPCCATLGLLSHVPVRVGDARGRARSRSSRPCCPTRRRSPPATPARPASATSSPARRTVAAVRSSSTRSPTTPRPTPEVGSQAISYTAGVPPIAAARLIASGEWDAGRMVNVEELDPAALHRPARPDGPADRGARDRPDRRRPLRRHRRAAGDRDRQRRSTTVTISAADPMIAVRGPDTTLGLADD